MKLTSIQISMETKKKLDQKKIHPRESYESVIMRVLENDEIPSLEEAFNLSDKIKQKRKYSTEEVIKLSHEWRNK